MRLSAQLLVDQLTARIERSAPLRDLLAAPEQRAASQPQAARSTSLSDASTPIGQPPTTSAGDAELDTLLAILSTRLRGASGAALATSTGASVVGAGESSDGPDSTGVQTHVGTLAKLAAMATQLGGSPLARTPAIDLAFSLADPLDTSSTARELADSLSHSGLFWESHLAEWANGERDAQALAREPLARGAAATSTAAHAAQDASAHESSATAASIAESRVPHAHAADESSPALPAPLMHRDHAIADKVLQQLVALDTRTVSMHGQAWPGQAAQLMVQDEHESPSATQQPRTLRATLSLTLPRLGDVRVQLTLGGDHLGVQVSTHTPQARHEARAALPALVERLDALGMQVGASVDAAASSV